MNEYFKLLDFDQESSLDSGNVSLSIGTASENKDYEAYDIPADHNHYPVSDNVAACDNHQEIFYESDHIVYNDLAPYVSPTQSPRCQIQQASDMLSFCQLCGLTFLPGHDLRHHGECNHWHVNFDNSSLTTLAVVSSSTNSRLTSSIFTCQFCSVVFSDPRIFYIHMDQFHSNLSHFGPDPRVFKSVSCVQTPAVQRSNPPDMRPLHSCDLGDIAFPLKDSVEAEFIDQLDGAISDIDGVHEVNQPATSRTAPYAFNLQKQTDKIKADATIHDFEVTVNNNNQNATIKCSSGFYIQVGKSSFVTITRGSSLSTNGIIVTLDDITETRDKNGLEATKLLHYSFRNEKESYGGVAVHLHHSTRTIQIQGSCIMPDSSRAALWFLNNVTINRFKEIAKAKKFEINNFNEAAKSCTGPKPTLRNGSCQSCGNVLIGKAKPSQCVSCQKYFHKSTCLKDHVKSCKSPPFLPSLPVPTPSASVTPPPSSSRSQRTSKPTAGSSRSIPGLRTSMTFIPSVESPEPVTNVHFCNPQTPQS